jgi:hypothetical protein
VVLFPAYAVIIWALTWRTRRSWLGFVTVAAGVLGVFILGLLHRFTEMVFPVSVSGPFFSLMLATEAAFVLVVGLFIATLPRHRVDRPCRGCRYELQGLDDANPTCPECGMAHAARKVKPRHCRRCGQSLLVSRGENPRCTGCGCDHCIREVTPPRPSTIARLLQPLITRYTTPHASTSKGSPRIIVVRNPDNTFSSIG